MSRAWYSSVPHAWERNAEMAIICALCLKPRDAYAFDGSSGAISFMPDENPTHLVCVCVKCIRDLNQTIARVTRHVKVKS